MIETKTSNPTTAHNSEKLWRLWYAVALAIGILIIVAIGARMSLPTPEAPQNDISASSFENFDTCALQGNPIMESFPEQCRSASGATFVNDVSIFTDTASGLVVIAPSAYRFTEGSDPEFSVGTFFGSPAQTIASVTIDPDVFIGTNARHAFLTYSAIADPSGTTCASFQRDGDTTKQSMASGPVISGVPFLQGETSGAAAGTQVSSRILHGLNGGTCYEIGMHLVTSNLANFPEGAVRPINEALMWSLLERVAERTAFTKV